MFTQYLFYLIRIKMYEYGLFKKKTEYHLIAFAIREYKIEISKDCLTSLVFNLKKKIFRSYFNSV